MTREERKIYSNQYYLKNKEKMNQQQAIWNENNKEQKAATQKLWNENHKEAVSSSQKKWALNHIEDHRESCRKWHVNNKDDINAKLRDQRKIDPDRFHNYEHKCSNKNRLILGDPYIKTQVRNRSNLPLSNIDENMIMLKRVEISCKRFIENGSTKIPLKKAVKL